MSRNTGEMAITDVVALTGTTSRTLRHYDAVGLLRPSRVGPGGQRFYDRDGLIRLQRILLMRDLGLGLPAIADVLARQVDLAAALAEHVTWLRGERRRIGRQLASVQRTLDAIREDTDMDTTQMFDGFNHSEHREEVEGKWGKEAFARGNAWWEAKTPQQRAEFQEALAARTRAWVELAASGAAPDGPAARTLARAHVDWLKAIPGTPASSGDPATIKAYVLGIARWYPTEGRFVSIYGGPDGAAFVQAALTSYAEAEL